MGVGAWGSVMEASIMRSLGGLKMNPQHFCALQSFHDQVVNVSTTQANEATRTAAHRGLGAHQLLLEGHGQRFAGKRGCGWLELFFVNAYATHRRRRTLRVWRSTTWTLATGSSAASTTSTPLSNPPALASPKPARTAPSCCDWHGCGHTRGGWHLTHHTPASRAHLAPHCTRCATPPNHHTHPPSTFFIFNIQRHDNFDARGAKRDGYSSSRSVSSHDHGHGHGH
jgi:hypothetical protein